MSSFSKSSRLASDRKATRSAIEIRPALTSFFNLAAFRALGKSARRRNRATTASSRRANSCAFNFFNRLGVNSPGGASSSKTSVSGRRAWLSNTA